MTDENGCSISIEEEITEPDGMDITYTTSDYTCDNYGVSCCDATDGSIDVTVMGGAGEYLYSWDNGEVYQGNWLNGERSY